MKVNAINVFFPLVKALGRLDVTLLHNDSVPLRLLFTLVLIFELYVFLFRLHRSRVKNLKKKRFVPKGKIV